MKTKIDNSISPGLSMQTDMQIMSPPRTSIVPNLISLTTGDRLVGSTVFITRQGDLVCLTLKDPCPFFLRLDGNISSYT